MKINLSEKEFIQYGYYLDTLENTIDEADYFNDILTNGYEVKKSIEPFRIDCLNVEPYLSNPYFKTVKPSKKKIGNITLTYDKYLPKQGFVYDEIVVSDPFFEERTPFGFFKKEFSYLAIKENGVTWMSVTPHEINTMKESIAKAKGHTTTLGLGLGYYAFMVSNKNEVSKVTIIETNQKIIDVFKKEILPFFPHKEKIEIIKEDAYEYLDKKIDGDYLFADLWHLPEDGLPMYTKLLNLENNNPHIAFDYWIEKSMLALLRRAIIILIDEESEGSDESSYKEESTFSDHLINQIHFILKEKEISSLKDVDELLSFESLKNIARKMTF